MKELFGLFIFFGLFAAVLAYPVYAIIFTLFALPVVILTY